MSGLVGRVSRRIDLARHRWRTRWNGFKAGWLRRAGRVEWDAAPSFHAPLRCDGWGRVAVGRGVQVGYVDGPRSGDGEVTLQARFPSSSIRVGDRTTFSNNVTVIAVESVEIGADCLVGDHVTILDSDFHHLDPARRNAPRPPTSPVVVGDNVWIGSRATLLRGVRVGRDAVVSAGAVVMSEVPAGTVVAGVPARVIGPVPRGEGT